MGSILQLELVRVGRARGAVVGVAITRVDVQVPHEGHVLQQRHAALEESLAGLVAGGDGRRRARKSGEVAGELGLVGSVGHAFMTQLPADVDARSFVGRRHLQAPLAEVGGEVGVPDFLRVGAVGSARLVQGSKLRLL